ncbi:Phosphatidylinositol transfer protein SEC14 [Handroanthus impetiginosus]|uniref:Phosphatidylinositol transfer protein SEC14 n=1 Tax=Handroanthus impetiginosus TaxID=429701 RepID=A0A2G9I4R7_9LAMI|nr:Phosphatidylinositol transfer protein SEC14 [Handroanthus impetiginosus]
MQETKELPKEIFISGVAGGNEKLATPSTKESAYAKNRTKSFHPPIENYWQWQSPPLNKQRKSYRSFSAILSHPFKYRNMRRSRSTQMVLEGPHNPKDEKLVDTFRELLFLEGQSPGKHFDYHTLLRFLRMRDFDMAKAKDMFMQYIKWRQEFGVDVITKEFKFEECQQVKIFYPHGFHGVDRYGRPVYIERIGMIDLDMLLQVTTIERLVKHHVCEQEKTLNWRYPACSLAAKKHIASTISILDVKNVGMSQFSKPARYLFLEIQRIDSNYYPETLHRLFIVNAGSGFRVIWKTIKAFLDARTLAKIRVLGADYKSSLTEAIDPSNLPSFLGGECTCSESGGCLFSDKGPWNDPEITEMLQGMLCTDDEEGGQTNASNEKSALSRDDENIVPYKEEGVKVDKVLFDEKIKTFEPVIEDAKQKINMLENSLQETKLVLQGLAQHLQELKR